MSVVVTTFSNDESARPPTLLKQDIFIDKVCKFENRDCKEHLGKGATILQKACILRACYKIGSW